MESEPQVTVLFTEKPDALNAYVFGPFTPRPLDAARVSRRYPHITGPLEHRGLECVEDFGLSEYVVHVLLPDGAHLTISPPQETGDAGDTIPGFPDSWHVTRDHPEDSDQFEVIYNSEPGGPHEHNRGSVPAMLAVVYQRLEQLGVPGREELLATQAQAEQLLREAGFVDRSTTEDVRFQLPPGVTGLAERSAAVTRAVRSFRCQGIGYACPADLLDVVVQAAPAATPSSSRDSAARTTSAALPPVTLPPPAPGQRLPEVITGQPHQPVVRQR
ncbi:hypothetical protein ABH931_005259 [Streptacidiphilus sp. MAP12-33]|uniref:hypothetical protein n=1 Tax=Streptacidiphilus sp. MAP12-33 TaxID=3156266 RepID=UPI0035159C0F